VTERRAEFTARASRELRAVRRWIAADGGAAVADQMIERLLTAARLLAERPKIGRERPEVSPGLRSFVAWPYVIFYRPLAQGARVVRVIHGHQDLDRAFGKAREGES
jgi:toxin ParE1/3/4